MKREVVASFQCTLSYLRGWVPCLSGMNFKEIGRDVVDRLEVPFIVDEVYAALSDLNGSWRPGKRYHSSWNQRLDCIPLQLIEP